MNSIDENLPCFQNILSKKNLKITPQRLEILNLIHKAGHIDIDVLYKQIKRHFPSVSLATIYKNITVMVKNDIINEVKINQNKTKYELVTKPHAHLICTNCLTVEDINIDEKCLLENVKGFNIQFVNIQVYGLCQNCKIKK